MSPKSLKGNIHWEWWKDRTFAKSNNLFQEECNSKNQLISLILEKVFKSDIAKVESLKNSDILLTPNEDYQFSKRFSKSHH